MRLSVSSVYLVGDGKINEYGAVGGTKIDTGNRSTRRKSSPLLFYPLKIPHDLNFDRTQPAACLKDSKHPPESWNGEAVS
jgi:hypothetical protein